MAQDHIAGAALMPAARAATTTAHTVSTRLTRRRIQLSSPTLTELFTRPP